MPELNDYADEEKDDIIDVTPSMKSEKVLLVINN